jgi:hypothetical protein
MPLPPLATEVAHGVLSVPLDEQVPRTEEIKQSLMASLAADFDRGPNLPVDLGASDDMPFVLLQSGSSQAAFTRAQADFEVNFTGDHRTSTDLARKYVARKMLAIFNAWRAAGANPVFAGLVVTLRASTWGQSDINPVQHVLDKHLRESLSDDALHDTQVQLGLRVAEHYLVTLKVGRYEQRQIVRQVLAGTGSGVIRPWEGETADEGIEVTVDMNNRLRALLERKHTRVDADEVQRLNDFTWDLVDRVATPLARDGKLDLSVIQAAVA